MSPKAKATPARSMIETWRQQHADVINPWLFHFIDALERRAVNHTGKARQLLDDRLARLMDGYAEDLAAATSRVGGPATPTAARGLLGELVDHLASHAHIPHENAEHGEVTTPPSELAELPALDEFRKTWSRLRSQSQLQQVDAQAPTNTGPLNSAALVHRSMALMRSLSPEYLTHFLAYIDDLAWMEQIAGSTSSTPATPRSGSVKKRTRSKSKSAPRD